jgi:hypothetical protein
MYLEYGRWKDGIEEFRAHFKALKQPIPPPLDAVLTMIEIKTR